MPTFQESEFVLSTHDGGFLISFQKSYELETCFGVVKGCQGGSIWSDGKVVKGCGMRKERKQESRPELLTYR